MKDNVKSGKEFYENIYKENLDLEIEWLKIGAREKVNSIELLLKRNNISVQKFLELGCGTGAVIMESQNRRLGSQYFGMDYSLEAISFLKENTQGIQLMKGDIMQDNRFFNDEKFDLVVLSHVVEHLEEPAKFLRSVRQNLNFSYAIIEVPLENLMISRFKDLFRDRSKNKAGHVQFFTGKSFDALLKESGYKMIDSRRYVPVSELDTIKFLCEKDGNSKLLYYIKIFTLRYLPKYLTILWSRFYLANYAVLCRKEQPEA